MVEIFNNDMVRIAVLPTAFDITETEVLNGVGSLVFSIPANDYQAEFCQLRNFVRMEGNVYRIIDREDVVEDGKPALRVSCEHAIATLVDNILFQDHTISGYSTREVLEYILENQSRWILGKCDFDFRYDYAWSSENLLTAMWSVATPFVSTYKWSFDTSSYPWVVNLEKIDITAKPEFYVIDKVNLKSKTVHRYSSDVVTRLYCLGYGEGVNQLDIRDVNGGLPYLEAPPDVIAKHGLIEAVFIDRRYEDANALKNAGHAVLDGIMNPRVEYEIEAADISPVNGDPNFVPRVGKVVDIKSEGVKTYITQVKHTVGDDNYQIVIANKPADLVTSIADLAERQRIESTYSQGATQLWGSPVQDNASQEHPLVYNLWIPEEAKIMNKVMVKITLDSFRAYSGTTEAAGGVSKTSSSEGGVSKSTQSGGGTTQTSKGSGALQTSYASSNAKTFQTSSTKAVDGKLHKHTVGVPLEEHRHVIQSHTHDVTFPSHTHEFSVPNHTHDVEFPPHKHEIAYGIYRATEYPKSAEILVNGSVVASMGTEFDGDITHLLVAEDGKIPRGQFLEIGIRPNTIAYVTISVAAQGFIQSKGGGRY